MRQLTRPWLALAVALACLAGCAPPPAPSYRGHGQKLYSIVNFSPARFAGTWHEVAGLYDPARQSCALGLTGAALKDGKLMLTLSDCAGRATTVPATRVAPGRFVPELRGPRSEPWWVLWVDEDYRTAVIGTPSGHWAAILNRSPKIPADRLTAAKRILEFNGYDIARLRPN